MSKKIGYMYLDGMVTVVIEGNAFDVDKKHLKYKEIVALIARPASETEAQETKRADSLLKLIESNDLDLRILASKVGWEDERVEHGVVTVKGKAMRTSLTQRIVDLKNAGLPYDAFVSFLVNLEANPSQESKDSLFDFLDQGKFPLTDDGCFLGYKGVLHDTLHGKQTLVDAHSRSFDMAPGNVHQMPREAVDNNRNEACGAGFHVGTINHARGFGDVMIVVKVNPADAVSVPASDTTKLRCCKYEVVNIFNDKAKAQELEMPAYSEEEYKSPTFESKRVEDKEEPEVLTIKELRSRLTSVGVLNSAREARCFSRETLVTMCEDGYSAALVGATCKELAAFVVCRGFFSNEQAARKAGAARMLDALEE